MSVLIPLDRIQDSPFQTRQHYDEAAIESLADSIERGGLDQAPKARLVPPEGCDLRFSFEPEDSGDALAERVVVLRVYDGGECLNTWGLENVDFGCHVSGFLAAYPDVRFQLAFGHRRLRAFRLIEERRRGDQVAAADGIGGGIPVGYMPVDLVPLTDEQMFAKAVGENAQRQDLSAVEEAEAMQAAIDRFGWTHETIGERFGYSRSAVSNKLRLLKLPEEVRALNLRGELSEAKCRALVSAFVAKEEHPDVWDPDNDHLLLEMALREETAERVRYWVGEMVEALEADVAEREAERKRREEPELFDDEDSQRAAAERAEGRHSFSKAEIEAAAEADEVDLSAEIERINDAHNKAILWVKDPSYIRAAYDDVLEKTLGKLRPLVRQIESIIEDSDREVVFEHGRDLDRIAGGIRYDIERVSREIERRKPAEVVNVWVGKTTPDPFAIEGRFEFEGKEYFAIRRDEAGFAVVNRSGYGNGVLPYQHVSFEGLRWDDADAACQAARLMLQAASEVEVEEYEPEVCEHCGEIDCERTCTPAMAEDGMFDAPAKPRTIAEMLGLPEPRLDEPYLWDEKPTHPAGSDHERAGKVLQKQCLYEIATRYQLDIERLYHIEYPSLNGYKEELLRSAKRAVQHVANYRCAYALNDDQLRRFKDWCDEAIGARFSSLSRIRREASEWERQSVHAAQEILSDLTQIDERGVFSPNHLDGYNRLCDAEHRRAAVFVYHLFYAEMAQPLRGEPDVSTETSIEPTHENFVGVA